MRQHAPQNGQHSRGLLIESFERDSRLRLQIVENCERHDDKGMDDSPIEGARLPVNHGIRGEVERAITELSDQK
jgi:hypothetical protein